MPTAGAPTANKSYAYSQYPHTTDYNCPWFRGGACYQAPTGVELTAHGRALLAVPPPAGNSTYMGFSVRSHQFRYTAWLPWPDKSQEPDWSSEPFRELYDHHSDTGQDFDSMDVVNVAYQPTYEKATAAMHEQCRHFFHELLPPAPGGGGNHSGGNSKVTKAACDAAGGVRSDDGRACCAKSCGQCGGQGCAKLPGGKMKCCKGEVEQSNRKCGREPAPCHG